MQKTFAAMFDHYEDAARAVGRLKTLGVPDRDIGMISNDAAQRERTRGEFRAVENDSEAASGAAIGGALGAGTGLLAGLGLLAIPGLGPVVAAGWVAATLVGAGAGAAAGGLIGSLVDAGVTEEDAHLYAEGIRRGGTLVTVQCDDAACQPIIDILDDEGTVHIDERAEGWRKEGWSGRFGGEVAPAAAQAKREGPGPIVAGPDARARVRSYDMPAGRSANDPEDLARERARHLPPR
jgi:hypothetical protein